MFNITLLSDAYKYHHYKMYPEGTEFGWSTWTPRKFRNPKITKLVSNIGLSYYVKRYLVKEFNEFFKMSWNSMAEDRAVLTQCYGITDFSNFKALHDLGYLPIEVLGLPEGTLVDANTPTIVITNTVAGFAWLVGFLETLMSSVLWMPSTSATIAREYRKIGESWAKAYYGSSADLGFIDWQFHDFSMRGMPGIEAAALSGLGHLTQFKGTDSTPAIALLRDYYDITEYSEFAGSVPASEHAVMSAGGKQDEYSTFDRLVNELYPEGIISVVSDTWDLWKVCTEYIPRMKEQLLKRNGKLVVRPDSSPKTPVEIVCGDPDSPHEVEKKGVLRLLNEAMGNTDGMINKVGVIYGDGIDLDRANRILERTVKEIGLSPYNMVFGVGSYSYQYNTRDTFGFAQKMTAVQVDGIIRNIFKDPVTDLGLKKSHCGITTVHRDRDGTLRVCQEQTPDSLYAFDCAYKTFFSEGDDWSEPNFEDIKQEARA